MALFKYWTVWILLALLFIFHNDFWLWDKVYPMIFNMPIGLSYHVLFMVVSPVVFFLFVLWVWPEHKEWPDQQVGGKKE